MDEEIFIQSESGATLTCRHCGTQYDNWGIDIEDQIPPVGDGCDYCTPVMFCEDEA